MNSEESSNRLTKVPELTLIFWLIKIAATTLGETGGDAVSMSLDLGYLVSTLIFMVLFLIAVGLQIRSAKFQPTLYWLTVIATTTVGTTLADFADRSLGIGYSGGSSLLLLLLGLSLFVWYRTMGTISVNSIHNAKTEIFYWVTIMFSQTLGTALGDWTADTEGFGYGKSAGLFGSLLVVLLLLYFFTKISRTVLFWFAFVLTRPLGAVVGDFLDKPIESGGLAMSRFWASGFLAALIAMLIYFIPQRSAEKSR